MGWWERLWGSQVDRAGQRPVDETRSVVGVDAGDETGDGARDREPGGSADGHPLPEIERLQAAVPTLKLALRPPCEANFLAEVEAALGRPLPGDVLEFYQAHDGQDATAHGLLSGMRVMPVADALREWRSWQTLAADAVTSEGIGAEFASVLPDAVREVQVHAGWFPLACDGGGNCVGIDLAPGPAGRAGQVIGWGADELQHRVFAWSLTDLLARVADLAEEGRAVVLPADDGPGSWGIDDGRGWWPDHRLFSVAEGDPGLPGDVSDEQWFAALEPAWQQRIGDDVSGFLSGTSFPSLNKDEPLRRVSDLEPLGRCRNLREVILHTRRLESLHDLPVLPRLAELIVCTLSLDGIDRFARLSKLTVMGHDVIAGAPGGDPPGLAPLAAARSLRSVSLREPNPDLRPLGDVPRLEEVSLVLRDAAQLSQLAGIRDLRRLTVDLTAVDQPLESLDWAAAPNLHELEIIQADASTLDWLDDLPLLRSLILPRLGTTDVSAIGRLTHLERLALHGEALTGVTQIGAASALRDVSLGFREARELRAVRSDLGFGTINGGMTEAEMQEWMSWRRS